MAEKLGVWKSTQGTMQPYGIDLHTTWDSPAPWEECTMLDSILLGAKGTVRKSFLVSRPPLLSFTY